MGAAWSGIQYVVPHNFISQKLKKLQRAECLPFCPTVAAFFLYQCCLTPHVVSRKKKYELAPQNIRNIRHSFTPFYRVRTSIVAIQDFFQKRAFFDEHNWYVGFQLDPGFYEISMAEV